MDNRFHGIHGILFTALHVREIDTKDQASEKGGDAV